MTMPIAHTQKWDLTSIPDDLFNKEWGRRRAAARTYGFCAVCDGVVCLCEPDTCPDMERSSRGVLPKPEAEAPAWKFPDVRKVRRGPAR